MAEPLTPHTLVYGFRTASGAHIAPNGEQCCMHLGAPTLIPKQKRASCGYVTSTAARRAN